MRKSMNDITIVDSVIDPRIAGTLLALHCTIFYFYFLTATRAGRVAVGDDQLAIKFCIASLLSSFVLDMR